MRTGKAVEWLFPPSDADEGFRQECLALSYRGARVAGCLEIGLAAAGLAGLLPWPVAAGIGAGGGLTLLARRPAWLFERLGGLVTLGAGLGAALAASVPADGPSGAFALAAATILLLAAPAAAAVPPWQGLLLGAVAAAAGAAGGRAAPMAAAGIAAFVLGTVLYRQRFRHYRSLASLVQASQEFREMQSRSALHESAAAMVQLTAALAHELSSPIGTLSSSVETLLRLAERQAAAPAEEKARLAALQSDLGRPIRDSLARLKVIVNRIQRLCSLDTAASHSADLNELLREAAAMVSAEATAQVEYRWNLGRLPELRCRPRQLLAVFWNILMNAVQALESEGVVTITSMAADGRVQIVVEDNGHGIGPERLAKIFEPAFQVAEGRVGTANWGLFTSRQLIKNHGGDLRIQSQIGHGATVIITLPCAS